MSNKIDYLCIGVAKAGTMSIINYLNLTRFAFKMTLFYRLISHILYIIILYI